MRFRRKLIVAMLVAGLLPALLWAAASWTLTDRVLAVSLDPLQDVLDRADEQLTDPALRRELADTRLQIAQAELGRRSLLRLAPLGFLGVLGASAALLVAAAWILARAATRRLEALAASVEHARPPAEPRDEIDDLAIRFHDMNSRLAVSEALAAWQEVARTLAHELKNPLTAMRLSVARLARQGELVDALTGELDVLLRMTESFSSFAKLPAPAMKPVELGALLEEVCALHGVAFAGAATTIHGDADQLRRAFTNLIKNAAEAGPPVEVRLDGTTVTIRDHGPGVAAPLDGRRLVTSLGTSKATGSGIGLPVTAKIVHDHGGELRLEPAEGGGARAVVRLPG